MSNDYDSGFDQPQQEQQQQVGGTNYDGRVAINPRTGARVVYRVSPTGKGRFVALSYETADPQSRDRYEELQNRLGVGERTVNLARNFMRENREHQSGGLQNDPNLPEFLRPEGAQRLANLSQQIVGANWIPGTSQLQNTNVEQQNIQRRYVSPTNRGTVNDEVFADMELNLAIQREAIADMQKWLNRHPNLNRWDDQWRTKEARIRQEFVPTIRQGGGDDFVRDPRTGKLVRAANR